VALGLVFGAAQGATPLAFALAGLVYIMIGLAYTELAATYPVAGGGQYFTMRGLGDPWGLVAGAALLLDYTIDIALFAVASTGYLNGLIDFLWGIDLTDIRVPLGPLDLQAVWLAQTMLLIGLLIWLNVRGIRESSLFNEVVGIIAIVSEGAVVVLGFLLAWDPTLLLQQWTMEMPSLDRFMYGSSLAIISYVGLESISQAAQETRRPATIVPRTSISLVFTVFIFAVAFSVLSMGVVSWRDFVGREGDAVALVAHKIPYLGVIAGPFAAGLGAVILAISANTGVMGASRLTYCMSRYHLISPWFDKVHPKYRTPVRAIVFFSLVGMVELVFSFLTPTVMDTLGNMYAFGATLGYTLVFISLIRLRFLDPYSPRPYKMPLNIKWRHNGRNVDIPVLGFVGVLGVLTILFEVVFTHEIGRIAGPAWVLVCLAYYVWYRRSQKLPFGSLPRDWEKEQMQVLTSAEEFELLEEYREALAERDRVGL